MPQADSDSAISAAAANLVSRVAAFVRCVSMAIAIATTCLTEGDKLWLMAVKDVQLTVYNSLSSDRELALWFGNNVRAITGNIYLFWLIIAIPAAVQIGTLLASGLDPAVAAGLEHGTGEMAVRLMIAAMAISPLQAIFGPKKWIIWLAARRRYLGVGAAGYAALHLLVYWIDLEVLDGVWRYVLEEALIFSIWTGYAALAIFLVMALTSNNASQRLLKANWKRLQRLVYPAAILVALHWVYIDNDKWQSAAIHFAPLLLLQIIRIIILWRKRRFNTG